jgi:hypothetical protein
VLHTTGLATEPQYWNQALEEGTSKLSVKTIVAAEHALLSWLVFVNTVSDGATSNTPQPLSPVPPQFDE